MTSLLVGKTRNWLIGDDVSGRILCVILNRQLYSILTVHKPHYRQQGRVCKAGTVITVDVSSEECTFLVGEARDQLHDLVGESRDQLRGDDVRGSILLRWPVG